VKFALGQHCYEDSIHMPHSSPELRAADKMEHEVPPTLRWSKS
jgi:hypothetical protein